MRGHDGVPVTSFPAADVEPNLHQAGFENLAHNSLSFNSRLSNRKCFTFHSDSRCAVAWREENESLRQSSVSDLPPVHLFTALIPSSDSSFLHLSPSKQAR
jgi:hypothetical protein